MEKQKVVVVSGATRGIGREVALLFAKKGYIVVAVYKSRDDLAQTLSKTLVNLNARSFVYRADVSDEADVAKLFDYIYNCFSSIDVLVNNAGIADETLLLDMTADCFLDMIQNNLFSVFLMCRAYVKRQTATGFDGSVVNVSSIYGVDGGAGESHYSAAKGGVIAFTKALAKEYVYMKIRANVVAPGAIATDMTLKHSAETLSLLSKEIPLGRLGTAEDIANGIIYLAEATYITGEVLRISGGL